ncbi:stress-inducible protein [Streptomyces longispororuber]|uniref:Stress-inducible protein n=1 Tax=Streptomyces longispororuber TaxID=68230 RepID=A0A919DW05_9ACTN|nr:universal stress protein [Streptomyces longispororuber]GHE90151.1 stress-inducible protein [Streptomyces longispororuber]
MKRNHTLSPSGIRLRAVPSAVPRVVTVGVDGSRASMDAADWAAREALRHDVPLRLVNAGAPPPASPARGHRLPGPDADRARGVLDRAAIALAYVHPALEIHAQQPRGPVVPALLAASAEAEALVLGSSGPVVTAGFTGFLAGSVATSVAARAERPVVLVRAGERPEDAHVPDATGAPSRTTPHRPVVLCLDVRDPGERLVEYAFTAATARGAPLRVLYAWSTPRSARSPAATDLADHLARERAARAELLGVLEPWRRAFPRTEVVARTVFGRPGPHLPKAAADASLLVVGRRTTAGPRLGRTAHAAIHHVVRPVAVVPYA